ncbi:MAG: DUF2264 domain-containing protein, partial [Lacrimispora sphenoides]
MKFEVVNPNYERSPFTGMDRSHWIEAGKFLLGGLFSHIKSIDDPVSPLRNEEKISYPSPGDQRGRIGAARFEGLARSLCMAV